MTERQVPSAPPPTRPWMKWLLLASLVGNGLLGGYVLGRVMMPPPPPGIIGLPGGMPPSLREAMRAEMGHGVMHQHFRGLREARGEIRDALRAEPFDQARLNRAFDKLLESQQSMQRDLQTAAAAAAARMTPEERRRLSEWRPERREMRERREGPGER